MTLRRRVFMVAVLAVTMLGLAAGIEHGIATHAKLPKAPAYVE